MSYESSAREAYRCDFVGCVDQWDQREGQKVSIRIGNNSMCFCEKHCRMLEKNGLSLRTWQEVTDEFKEEREAPERDRSKREQEERERRFIVILKTHIKT